MLINMSHFNRNWIINLCHIHVELAKAGDSIERIGSHGELLDDLAGGPSERALALMHNEQLYEEVCQKNTQGKRKVEITLSLRRNGTLSVQWAPETWSRDAEFLLYRYYWERPANELLSVRGVGLAMGGLTWRWRSPGRSRSMRDCVDQGLLLATAGAIKALKERLQYQFDVQMKTDIFMGFTSDESGEPMDWNDDELVDWRIEAAEEIVRLVESRELKKLSAICPIETFVDAVERSRQKKKAGPATKGTNEGVSRLLRNDGFKDMSATAVGKYRQLLRMHSPEALPSWDRPT